MSTHELCEVIDDFCERLLYDANGPEKCREYLQEDELPTEARRAGGKLARDILSGKQNVIGKHNVKQPGERYVKETLIWPLLDALGHTTRIESFLGESDKQADFRIVSTPELVVGECKSPNKYEKAIIDVRENIDEAVFDTRHAIVTDGLNWSLLTYSNRSLGGEPEYVAVADIRPAIASRFKMHRIRSPHRPAREGFRKSSVSQSYQYETDTTRVLEDFSEKFSRTAVNESSIFEN